MWRPLTNRVSINAVRGSNPPISKPMVTNSIEPANITIPNTGGTHQGKPWLVA